MNANDEYKFIPIPVVEWGECFSRPYRNHHAQVNMESSDVVSIRSSLRSELLNHRMKC